MENILSLKKKKLEKIDKEYREMGVKLGLDDGTAEFAILDRICDETATELDWKRIENIGVFAHIEFLKLSRERLQLIREIHDMGGKEEVLDALDSKNARKDVHGD